MLIAWQPPFKYLQNIYRTAQCTTIHQRHTFVLFKYMFLNKLFCVLHLHNKWYTRNRYIPVYIRVRLARLMLERKMRRREKRLFLTIDKGQRNLESKLRYHINYYPLRLEIMGLQAGRRHCAKATNYFLLLMTTILNVCRREVAFVIIKLYFKCIIKQ